MDPHKYHASCAVCGSPADPDCPSGCESARLTMAIDQAEAQWQSKWREKIRQWVANTAIRQVTHTFDSMKQVRIANHSAYIKTLPYFSLYRQYGGHPPLHPHIISNLRQQLHEADQDLQRDIDSDWRQCVVQYPEIIKRCYTLVDINVPERPDAASELLHVMPAAVAAPSMGQVSKQDKRTDVLSMLEKERRSKQLVQKPSDERVLDGLARMLQDSRILEDSRDHVLTLDAGVRSRSELDRILAMGVEPREKLGHLYAGSGFASLSRDFEPGAASHLDRLPGLRSQEFSQNSKGIGRSGRTLKGSGRRTAPPTQSPFDPPDTMSSWANGPFAS